MKNNLISCSVLAALMALMLASAAFAQPAPAPAAPGGAPVRSVLASAPLPSVVDAPRYFRTVRVSIPAKQATSYNGAIGFVVALTGSLEVASGAERQVIEKGEAAFVPGGRETVLRAGGGHPAVYLHVALATAAELRNAMASRPATVSELHTTAEPIPGLNPGPYEFTLVRVTFPPHAPFNPPHRRSGAAMYYIMSGTGTFTTGGNTETKPTGVAHYEPFDLVHQWANPGDLPLVIIQANISHEGTPAVIFVPEAGATSGR